MFFSNIDCLSRYLETSQFDKLILIINQDCATLSASRWRDANSIVFLRQIDFPDLNSLLEDVDNHITQRVNSRRTSGELISSTSVNRSQRDVSNESFQIWYYCMYEQILLDTDEYFDDNVKSELSTLCRNEYPKSYINDIQDFKNNYPSSDAIR